jgi:hypothetical protein
MAKELVQANENWSVTKCLREIKKARWKCY